MEIWGILGLGFGVWVLTSMLCCRGSSGRLIGRRWRRERRRLSGSDEGAFGAGQWRIPRARWKRQGIWTELISVGRRRRVGAAATAGADREAGGGGVRVRSGDMRRSHNSCEEEDTNKEEREKHIWEVNLDCWI